MAENVTLADLANLSNDGTAIAAINSNNTIIEEAFLDCLSLEGTQPNALQSNLDMNNFNIINLPSPSTINSPVRVTDLNTFANGGTITLNPLPVGGSTNAVLHKNSNTDQDASWTLTPSGLTSIGATSSTVVTSNITSGAILTKGSGATTVQASAAPFVSNILTLPITSDTLIGKATVDTLTNKTFDTVGAGNVFKINGTNISAVSGTGSVVLNTSPTITTPNIVGTSTNNNAAAGSIGEVISSTIASGSAVPMTTATPANITSITLTAGDWDVSGRISYVASAGGQTFHYYTASLSTTTGAIDQTNGRFGLSGGAGDTFTLGAVNLTISVGVGPVRFSVAGSTTIFLVGQISFATTGTNAAYGILSARRAR